ncbi:MAG: branched-chain amino acid ABC transporter permease [Accumulibacter sp.]|jgi:branched-chain amino acid transport system permease protein
MDYVLHLLVFVLLFGMVALSLNVASGFTQLISVAHAGFFGVGAYTTAILATRCDWPLWVNLPIGMVLAGFVALPVALVALRTVEDYFIICTMGMGVILSSIMNNWMELTRGPLGISGIPAVTLLGHPLIAKWEWAFLAAALYAAVFLVARNLKRSALGRLLVAIGEDEIFCQSLGKNVGLAKIQSFVLSAMLAAVPGALYAHYVSFIDPTSFTIHESIFILSIIIVGGMGNLCGSLAAAAFMILAPEALRFVGLSGAIAANIRQMLYGAALVLVVIIHHSRARSRSVAFQGDNAVTPRAIE